MKASDWQPIETAPKDGTPILLGRKAADEDDWGISTLGWWQDSEPDGVDCMGSDAGFIDYQVNNFFPGRSFGAEKHRYRESQPTHWMPLPEPPSATETV